MRILVVILACCCCCSIALADDGLLDALDLSRPELSQVRSAYEKGDSAKARNAFAAYLRARQSPRWKIDPVRPPREISADQQREADDALAHKIYSEADPNFPWQFADRIDWSFDPTTQPTSTIVPTPEWTWAVNRHHTWAALARAYTVSGDPKYGLEFCKQMQAWVEDNPPPKPEPRSTPRMRWRPIEAGIRMSNTWPEVYYRLIHHPDAMPDEALVTMVDSMRQHAEYLDIATTWGGGNHLAVELDGLYHVGAIFPEFKHAEHWRNDAMERARKQIDEQVYPDGVQKELAPGYHMFAQDSFTGILALAQWNHYSLPPDYRDAMEKMYAANMGEMAPDRTCPPFNDSPAQSIMGALSQGLEQFPNRDDWRWVVSDGKEGQEPQEKSHVFDYAGWPVMRSGWDRDARYLLMECGPFGLAHQHEDKLSFILHAYGSCLVSEAGIYTYDESEMRKYVLSARAHNVIHIDGLEQNRRGGPAKYKVTDKPIAMGWQSTDRYDYAQGNYGTEEDERWGPKRISGFVHTRRVLFIKPDYWVVIDTISPPAGDEREHVYQSTFHLNCPEAKIDPATNVVHTVRDGANLAILPLNVNSLGVRIVAGQKEPFYQGWVAPGDTELQEVPSATPHFTLKGKGRLQFLYVFSPSKRGEAGPVKSIAATEVADSQIAAEIALSGSGPVRVALMNDDSLSISLSGNKVLRIGPPK